MPDAGMKEPQLSGSVSMLAGLTPLSPLSDRKHLKASPGLDHIALGLASFGFSTQWEEGQLQVSSPVTEYKPPPGASSQLTVDTFLGALTRPRSPFRYNPHKPATAPSSLLFTKTLTSRGTTPPALPQDTLPPSFLTASTLAPPASPDTGHPGHTLPSPLPGTPQGHSQSHLVSRGHTFDAPSHQSGGHPTPHGRRMGRFHHLAQSVESLHQLGVAHPGARINRTNLIALTQPLPGRYPRSVEPLQPHPLGMGSPNAPSSPPCHLQIPRSAPASPVSPLPDQASWSTGRDGVGTRQALGGQADMAQPSPRHGPSAAPGGGVSRLTTPLVVDVSGEAAAALAGGPEGQGQGGRQVAGRVGTAASAAGSEGGKARTPHPMAFFKPTRAHSLLVFQHMDLDKNGKVTRAELEEAALSLGFSLEQAHRLFARIDQEGKGYLLARDWGQLAMQQVVQLFTLQYMQRFMGLPGPTSSADQVRRYQALQQLKAVRSVPAAINLARVNALARTNNSHTQSGNPIFDAFSFIDTDRSGFLSFEELRDGFYALGVDTTDEVIDQLMTQFDADGNGRINYHEFVNRMFPRKS
ncbi:hypothetical protein QJQ45_018288 [Haematococcus lacustris]|nr:hypothetical protein QJQ45_018288 [Haematococcus lacustris]